MFFNLGIGMTKTQLQMDQIKHYKILERIGSGGMGSVYKAHDTVLERDVAIKIMHPHLLSDEQNSVRLMREARAAAKLVHPNVVTIYEIGEEQCGHYIVMEYIQGMPLSDFIYENKSIDPERAVKLTIQILRALSLAHNEGILHRDIKSDNIFLTPHDEVKVLDFGIAKLLNNKSLTAADEVLGTIEYMAPEQMLGEEIDQRCDVYAVGIVLYQLLTQRLPFTGESPVQILFNKLNEDPIPPSNFNSKVDNDLNLIALRAIAHEKEERWKSATDFADTLDSFLHKIVDKKSGTIISHIDFDLEVDEGKDDDPSILRNVFVGRSKEFKQLVKSFNNTKSGNGLTHIIRGEAGVGKSSLAKKFTVYSEYQNAWVLYGLCLYQEGLDAYLPFVDAIRAFFSRANTTLNDQDRIKLKGLIRKNVPILAEFTDRFTTTLIPQKDVSSTNNPEDRKDLLESFSKLISIMAEIRPVILILDDLQWADAASLKLFYYLSRNVSNYPAMLIGITRSDRFDLQENGKPTIWVETMRRMNREELYKLIDLDSLTRENCDQLIDKSFGNSAFSDEFHHNIFNSTKGNPFFILESLKTLQAKGSIKLIDDVWVDEKINFKLEVPNRVEDIFIQRLNAIKDQEREILQVAAVIGQKFDPSLLSNILDIPKIKLLKSLEYITRDLEIIHSDEKHYHFEHPLLGELLYNEIPAVLRKEYHLMIANQLVKIYGSDFGSLVGEVAQHFRRGGDHLKAITPLYQAAKRSFGISAYREASLFIEDLLDSLDQSKISPPKDISLNDVFFKLGICYEEMGNWEESIHAYIKLEETSLMEKNYSKHVNAIMRTGRIYDKLGNWRMAKETYERCLELAKKYKIKNVKSRIFNNMGIYFFHKGDFDSALEYFKTSIQSVDSKEGEFDEAHAYTNIGIIANILRGPNGVALENFKKALEIYEQKDSKLNQARVFQNIGMIYADRCDWDKSIESFQNCLSLTDGTDEKQLRALTYLNLGKTYARKKELLKAKSFTEKAVKMFKRMNDVLGIAEAYHIYGLIYGTDGDFNKAKSFLNESIKINMEKEYQEGLADTYESYARLSYENNLPDVSKEFYKKAVAIYSMMNIDVKVKELYKYIENINFENNNNNNIDNKLLTKKYGKSVSHS
jgi:serine/threonine protein kinase/tetratricopeptide (TPR) repeat protein